MCSSSKDVDDAHSRSNAQVGAAMVMVDDEKKSSILKRDDGPQGPLTSLSSPSAKKKLCSDFLQQMEAYATAVEEEMYFWIRY